MLAEKFVWACFTLKQRMHFTQEIEHTGDKLHNVKAVLIPYPRDSYQHLPDTALLTQSQRDKSFNWG